MYTQGNTCSFLVVAICSVARLGGCAGKGHMSEEQGMYRCPRGAVPSTGMIRYTLGPLNQP